MNTTVKRSGITWLIYGISIILLLFTVLRFYVAMDTVALMVNEQDYVISEHLIDVIYYFYEQCASPFLFSIVLYILGEINEKLKIKVCNVPNEKVGN